MQGTSVVTTAALLTAMERIEEELSSQRIVIFGAGTAGVGIADSVVDAMIRQGVSRKTAIEKIWLIDRNGLLAKETPDLLSFQMPYARETGNGMSLESLVEKIQPTVLIGCSAVGGAFTEKIVRKMASYTKRPIIFPLSNPTAQSEAVPDQLMRWTDNRALIATGSPFGGYAQCNNAFSFPGVGLGLIAAKARRLTDNMLWAACLALSHYTPKGTSGPLLPPLAEARQVAYQVALAIVDSARQEGVAQIPDNVTGAAAIQEVMWEPYYRPFKAKQDI